MRIGLLFLLITLLCGAEAAHAQIARAGNKESTPARFSVIPRLGLRSATRKIVNGDHDHGRAVFGAGIEYRPWRGARLLGGVDGTEYMESGRLTVAEAGVGWAISTSSTTAIVPVISAVGGSFRQAAEAETHRFGGWAAGVDFECACLSRGMTVRASARRFPLDLEAEIPPTGAGGITRIAWTESMVIASIGAKFDLF